MKGNPFGMSGFQQKENSSIWEWKGVKGAKRRKQGDTKLSVTQFIQDSRQKVEEAVVGPGVGSGVGCGVGVGWGVVGGVGMGDASSSWNQLKMVFGIGMGCGVGLGIGYGYGIGVARTLVSIKDQFFKPKGNTPRKPIVIKI